MLISVRIRIRTGKLCWLLHLLIVYDLVHHPAGRASTQRKKSSTRSLVISLVLPLKFIVLLDLRLLESAYEACLMYELRLRRLNVEHQKPLPIFYKDVILDCGYRLDIVVENQVIVEIKSVSGIAPIHEAQLLSYLKMSDYKRGLLINFNVTMLKDGLL